jgi:hypothetical protein
VKKLIVFLAVLLLTACGNDASSNLEKFDHSKLEEDIKDEAYQSKLPTGFPFEIESASYTPVPENQRDTMQTFQFYGINGEYIELRTNSGEVHFSGIEGSEQVSVNNHDGTFGETENGSLSLHWEDGDITYHLMAKGDEVTKEELIATAESFEE